VNEYLKHLIELRVRLIRVSLVIVGLFLLLFWQDEVLYHFIASPLLDNLKPDDHLIATEVTTPFTVPLKLAFTTSIYIAIPYILFELWSFVAPALYKREKRSILPILIGSILLFYIGTAFAYYVICPMALQFFTNAGPKKITIMTDIRHYLDFMLTVLFGGGIAFQVPVVTLCCIKSGIVTIKQLIHLRPYIIVAAFVLGMLLTPPDVISQILLALPMWGLFELGLVIGKFESRNLMDPAGMEPVEMDPADKPRDDEKP
jgi:sec-independent protein translocase protein TatC